MAIHSSPAAAAAYAQPPLSPNPERLVVNPALVTPAPTGVLQQAFLLLGELLALDPALVMGEVAKAAGFRINTAGKLTWSAALVDYDILTFHLMFRCPHLEKPVRVLSPITEGEFFTGKNTLTLQSDATAPGRYYVTIAGTRRDLRLVQDPGFDVTGLRLYMDPDTGAFFYCPYASFYGDPLVEAPSFGPRAPRVRSWSYRANLLRQAAGLKRLNAAGDEVDGTGTAETDFTTEAGYNKLGLSFASGDYATLKNSEGLFDTTGATADEREHKRIRFSTFMVAMEENPRFPTASWQKNAKPHFPAAVVSKTMERRDLTTTPPPLQALAEQDILQDATGPYAWEPALPVTVTVAGSVTTLTFAADHRLNAGDELELLVGGTSLGAFPVATVAPRTVTLRNVPAPASWAGAQARRRVRLAVKCADGTSIKGLRLKKDKTGYHIETGLPVGAVMDNASGVTMGMGLDLGAGFEAGVTSTYQIELTASSPPAGEFTLYYGNEALAGIPYSASAVALAEKLKASPDLAAVLERGLLKVTKAGNRWTLTIKNATYRVDERARSIFLQRFSTGGNAQLRIVGGNPDDAADSTGRFAEDWTNFERVMNHSHAYGTTGDGWLGGLPEADRPLFKALARKCFGVQQGGAWVLRQRNKALFDAFAIPDWVRHLRAVQAFIMVPKYHQDAAARLQPRLTASMNEFERYVMNSITWNHRSSFTGSGSTAQKVRDFFSLGINSHNLARIHRAVQLCGAYPRRKEQIGHLLKPHPVTAGAGLKASDLTNSNRKVSFPGSKPQVKVGGTTYPLTWADPSSAPAVTSDTRGRLYAHRGAFFVSLYHGIQLDVGQLLAYFRHHP
ncbi:hypothetical protein P2318_17895 [Myxococcaceae bacterium GXIMD 01537]